MDSVDISCAVLLGPSNGSLVSQLAARSYLDVSRESLKAPAHVSPATHSAISIAAPYMHTMPTRTSMRTNGW